MKHCMNLERSYGACNYDPPPIVLTRGEGAYVWDAAGYRYLDMMSAYSAASHGHCHPRLMAALCTQAKRLTIMSRAFYSDRLGPFLERACELTGMERALPMNTGVEAVETALKAARKWAYTVKGVAEEQAQIIVCDGNFHGRTIAVIGFSSEPRYRAGFGPFAPGFVRIPYGDSDALARAVTPNTAAFLVEPIQGEGGIHVPPAGYLARCAQICKANDVLLLCDEVQTGLGRTGRMLASEHDGVRPDGLTLGKALGGGMVPVSLFLARADVMDVFGPGDHGSTFGGNPLAAAVGLEALNVLVDERLAENAARLGGDFLAALRALESPLIKEVRGKGLLIGVEFEPGGTSALEVREALAEEGVLTKETHGEVIRLAPPLVVTSAQIDTAVTALASVLRHLERRARRPVASRGGPLDPAASR